MDWEAFEKHKPYAGEKKPSMLRRRVGHGYGSRRIYLIIMTIEGRRPILGCLVGRIDAPEGSPDAPRIELSALGIAVKKCWESISTYYPSVKVLATMIMPDHLHGILFAEQQMDHHLGMVIKGFKAGCNKAYRQLLLTSQPGLSMPQQCCGKGDTGGETKGDTGNPHCGFLWSRNYNDHILEGAGELKRWYAYLYNNPKRLAFKRKYPDFFRVRFGVTIGSHSYAAIGNRFLLDYPKKLQVQCSRKLTEQEIQTTVEQLLSKARSGAVLASPAISK